MSAIDNARAALAKYELAVEGGHEGHEDRVDAAIDALGPLRDLIAEHELLDAQPGWEYGVTGFDSTRPVSLRETLEGALEAHRYWIDVIKAPSLIYRRRPAVAAGAWEQIESMPTDHTNRSL